MFSLTKIYARSLNLYLFSELLFSLFCRLSDADRKGDGKRDPDEWKDYDNRNPSVLKIMTIAHLM